MENKAIVKQFYKELGRLLYSVAMADKKIEKEELKALHEFVSKDLAHFETSSDSSGMNKAFYVDFEFEDYANHHVSVQQAHDSFMNFLDAHVMEIDPKLIEKSVEAVEKVANAFRKVNKAEREMIDRIKSEIKEMVELF
jgi:hypothetical protein